MTILLGIYVLLLGLMLTVASAVFVFVKLTSFVKGYLKYKGQSFAERHALELAKANKLIEEYEKEELIERYDKRHQTWMS